MRTAASSVLAAILAGLLATACSETASQAPQPQPAATAAAPAMRSGSPQDESACLAAVSRETKNRDVSVVSSEFSQANTEVVVGVGPNRAKWRCLVSKGRVAEVMSLTDEGAL